VLPANVLDLNSTPTVSTPVSSSTIDLVANGGMTLATGVPTAGPRGQHDDGAWVSRNGALRYDWTGASGGGTPTATLSQALTLPADTSTTSYVQPAHAGQDNDGDDQRRRLDRGRSCVAG